MSKPLNNVGRPIQLHWLVWSDGSFRSEGAVVKLVWPLAEWLATGQVWAMLPWARMP